MYWTWSQKMPDIRDQKLLYHLTRLTNLQSILQIGLLPRARLRDFADVADPEIIASRRAHGLEEYVPFHWFARNPFDGRVQADHPGVSFAIITVRRALAESENWTVIPCHPLANTGPELLSYKQGVAAIDWETMNKREYHDRHCKSVCMAECLSPRPVQSADFFKIYAPDEDVAAKIQKKIDGLELTLEVVVNGGMFLR
jgi:hypothetical protein